MRSLIDILDLSTQEIDSIIDVAADIMKNPAAYSEKCRGKKLATLFFEPSTRTRLSFEAAMYELEETFSVFRKQSRLPPQKAKAWRTQLLS